MIATLRTLDEELRSRPFLGHLLLYLIDRLIVALQVVAVISITASAATSATSRPTAETPAAATTAAASRLVSRIRPCALVATVGR